MKVSRLRRRRSAPFIQLTKCSPRKALNQPQRHALNPPGEARRARKLGTTRSRSHSRRPRVYAVDLGRHDEVVLMQSLDLLGLQRDRCIAPTEADVRMMAFGFRELANLLDNGQRLPDAMLVRQSEACPCCSAVLRVAWNRRRFLAAAGGGALGLSFSRFACAEDIPVIGYESVPDLLHLPSDLYLGEVSGVALNSKGHIFVLHRGDASGPAYGAAAAQLLEFDADGNYLREIGHHLYAWSFAHAVKVDVQDYVWVTDKGSDMVIKFTPEGRVDMVFGRKQEAWDEGPAPLKHPNPPLPAQEGYFRQVTDVAMTSAILTSATATSIRVSPKSTRMATGSNPGVVAQTPSSPPPATTSAACSNGWHFCCP
jgi:hypothetical protein